MNGNNSEKQLILYHDNIAGMIRKDEPIPFRKELMMESSSVSITNEVKKK